MAIRKVARMGHPVLRKKARELTAEEIRSPETKRLIQDMIETMHEYGGIGIAAPQIHESLRVSLIEVPEEGTRYPGAEAQSLTVFINPKLTVVDEEEQGFWEGCLSVPDLRGLVYRPRKVQVDYLDLEGNPRSVVAEGFLATVFQHEFDHLDGVLYVDRLKDTKKLAFIDEYQKYWLPVATDDVGELAD